MRVSWLLLAGLASAAGAQPADLPPAEIVARVLDMQPAVAAAEARVAGAVAEGEALRRGQHEVVAEAGIARRTIDGDGGYSEYDATVSRPFRLPGKAALDRRAGALGVDVAKTRAAVARRQAALALAEAWYDWLEAGALHRNALASADNQRALVQATARRVQLRDAALLELEQTRSGLALAMAQAQQAAADRDRARALLEGRFPDLSLPAEPPVLLDPLPPVDLDALQARIIANSPEIGAAAAAAERSDIMMRRARADRVADPSFGLRLFRERGGEERGVGLVASLPLGGGYRRALSDQAAAEASAALSERFDSERMVRSDTMADIAELRARYGSWRAHREAVASADKSAALAARGQALGALDLADRLYSERQASDARANEIAARGQTARLIAKLSISANLLWAED